MLLMQESHWVKGLDPVADAFTGTKSTDVVSMSKWRRCTFIIFKGVGTTGTSIITVEACDNFTPSNTTAVPFWYRTITTGDTPGALTRAAAAGFTTGAGSSELYVIEVDVDELADSGYPNVRLKAVESVDALVLGCVRIQLSGPRVHQETHDTVIV